MGLTYLIVILKYEKTKEGPRRKGMISLLALGHMIM
jgi:hypothetical protein